MTVANYIESRERFIRDGIGFAIVTTPEGYHGYRAVCFSTRESNDNGTNGVRLDNGFLAFVSGDELNQIVALLSEESRNYGVQFNLDDELTKSAGRKCLYYYKMSKLRSPVVA
ncbi:MAG: hypothetical protein NTW35_03695 [Candidatus Nomurabacteria bacterium]|nr:hypothetical protein [Candidatus Nomurabacteria bacterium]